VFQPGTTDQSLASARPLLSQPLGDSTLTVTQTGKYPVLIGTSPGCGGADGPFHFAALVTHAAVVSLPALRSIGRSGTVTAGVASPDGKPITDAHLVLTLKATYTRGGRTTRRVLGRAAAVSGHAVFAYQVPASASPGRVTLTLTAHGASYRAVRAATRITRLLG
jgi:hypothetical protein